MRDPRAFLRARNGATSIEYGLIIASIALAVIVAMQMLGVNLASTFWTLANIMA